MTKIFKNSKYGNPESTRNFIYFAGNFGYDFIEKCWHEDECLAKHLRSKFSDYCEKDDYGSIDAFFRFFFNLSEDNQIMLISWVEFNYCSFIKYRTSWEAQKRD